MEATLAPETLAPADVRARLHHVIDQIADEAVLRAALLLLLPQAPAAEAPEELSAAWLQEIDRRLAEYDPAKSIPWAETMQRLNQTEA